MNKHISLHTQALCDDPRWQAVLERDPEADGQFVYAISTTGIYCRPTCPSRRPKPEHTQIFDQPHQAEKAGYRPCLRCVPQRLETLQQQQSRLVEEACRLIRDNETAPDLSKLAEHAGFSMSHFHKLFKQVTGITPKKYAQSLRLEKLEQELTNNKTSVTEAIYNSGYNESSNFYASRNRLSGMTASAHKKGGTNIVLHYAIAPCSLGKVLVAATSKGISSILLGDDDNALLDDLRKRFPKAEITASGEEFTDMLQSCVAFIEQPQPHFDLPLDIHGTIFQQKIWQILRQIPPGETVSYAELARLAGMPKAARAVAGACAANPVAVVVPCHRVVRNDSGLSGYRWGVERKRTLLNKEKITADD
ncbi:bifunctional DNA-binding transcriptional regulator/O6-methylguanine-DNA methyltransferase Ada [Pseudochrobactrum asaccharolyticum]|uniref:bifunctional DNA-binding transcriptional regulator/O6-methylguanine-DNA methyltransferase Ada n=1 Tax=Pseudochrobactrum asaccharolyticum TaxID=354351 RepID=UPI00404194C8